MSFRVGQLRVVTKAFWGWADGPSNNHDRINVANYRHNVLLVLGAPQPPDVVNASYVEVLTVHGKQDIDHTYVTSYTKALAP